jgi:hypothetical protein
MVLMDTLSVLSVASRAIITRAGLSTILMCLLQMLLLSQLNRLQQARRCGCQVLFKSGPADKPELQVFNRVRCVKPWILLVNDGVASENGI